VQRRGGETKKKKKKKKSLTHTLQSHHISRELAQSSFSLLGECDADFIDPSISTVDVSTHAIMDGDGGASTSSEFF
jgi:hypothetical protein